MLRKQLNTFFFIIALFIFQALSAYEVRFEGLTDPKVIESVRASSQTLKLKDKPPTTNNGLKRRAEDDIISLAKSLQSLGYYTPKITFEISKNLSEVIFHIDPGFLYHFSEGRIQTDAEDCDIDLKTLRISVGSVALPSAILDAEDTLLDQMNLKGYAFAQIEKRNVLVDQDKKLVTVTFQVNKGPLSHFGSVSISGLERVRKSFLDKKLQWKTGEVYNPIDVAATQEALELSGLFKSVNITHGETVNEQGILPIYIDVVEGKQRSIGFGANYTTQLGPGITAEWEDRNVNGEGEQLMFRADVSPVLQESKLSYTLPDFGRPHQNLVWLAEYQHEEIKAFTESAFSLSGTIVRRIDSQLQISYGGMYKLLRSTRSNNNRTFDLIKTPLQLRWSNADSLLNPTKGTTINLKVIPSLQFLDPTFAYSINTLTGTYYKSFTGDDRAVFAGKIMLGSIVGANKHDIPPPERFYAGSENTLRGYKYLTVSPLNDDNKPIGGRSLMIFSAEMRFRLKNNWGIVGFYEAGNVYATPTPQFDKPLLQSVGIGFRYHTIVGPLRLDVAVPLNPRPHLDSPFQIYFSIGQSF